MGAVDPNPEKLRAFAGTGGDTPIVMINLLRFRERADYPPGADAAPCTGREAYGRYAAVALGKVREVGGRILWQGGVAASLIAAEGEEWDEAILVEYPSVRAFLEMIGQADYQTAAIHRTASLEDSRLIATATRVSEL